MEKMILAICISLFTVLFILDFLFPDKVTELASMMFCEYNIFGDLRNDYNNFFENLELIEEMNAEKKENIENVFFSPIYKREYDELITLYKVDNTVNLAENFSLCVLINTMGDTYSEILRIKSDRTIPSKGFIVSSELSSIVGKIIKSYGKIADVAPIWSNHFSSQVYIVSENEIEGIENDLALIEKRLLINFNPALPYAAKDEIKIATNEFGGYNLERYGLNRIGMVSNIKSTEIVEHYEIEYDYTREEILKNRYFFIVENIN